MEHTFFEAPEYPIWNQVQKGAVSFVKYFLALAAALLALRATDLAYGAFQLKLVDDIFSISVNAIIYDLVFMLKCIPVLYLFFLLILFSLRERHLVYIATYVLMGTFLLINIFFTQYSYIVLTPVSTELLATKFNFSGQLNLLFLILTTVSFVVFTLTYRVSETFVFVDKYFAYFALIIGLVLLFSGMSTVPERSGFKADADYLLTVNRTSFFIEKASETYFENEPEVDIYDANYLD